MSRADKYRRYRAAQEACPHWDVDGRITTNDGETHECCHELMWAEAAYKLCEPIGHYSLVRSCRILIARADAAGVALDDGNIVDLIADATDAELSDIRRALAVRFAERFPKATGVLPTTPKLPDSYAEDLEYERSKGNIPPRSAP